MSRQLSSLLVSISFISYCYFEGLPAALLVVLVCAPALACVWFGDEMAARSSSWHPSSPAGLVKALAWVFLFIPLIWQALFGPWLEQGRYSDAL